MMSALEQPVGAVPARPRGLALDRILTISLGVPAALFILGLATRGLATLVVRFPASEGSAYYVTVARNLVGGRGFELDAIWSYATPPLTLPRPAFELWQPLASLIAAGPMTILGPTFAAAQIGFVLLGALLGPLVWLVARDAARRLAVPDRRATILAAGAGALTAVSGPLVMWSTLPDSSLPFAVAAVAACLVMPRAISGGWRAIAALGALLGLAYLARLEAIYLGAAFLGMLALAGMSRRRQIMLAGSVAGIGALVALPWWLRNVAEFGTPLPGQLAHNALLTRNEQIFAYHDQPTLDAFLAQGAMQLAANVATAAGHNLVDVLIVPGGLVAALGLIGFVVFAARGSFARLVGSPLGALLVAGALTYGVTTAVFPVATLWGTFEHASGPLVVAFIVLAAVAGDHVVARIRTWRAWPRSNAWLAPAAMIALTVPVTVSLLLGAAAQAARSHAQMAELGQSLPRVLAQAGVAEDAALISDRPIWLSDELGRPVLALPDERPESVLGLARQFGAQAVVIVEGRGGHPAGLRSAAGAPCFIEIPGAAAAPGTVFVVAEACR